MRIINIECKLLFKDDLKTYNYKQLTITSIKNKVKPDFQSLEIVIIKFILFIKNNLRTYSHRQIPITSFKNRAKSGF